MIEINKIANKHLGKNTHYSNHYDPTLLVSIPRHYNRSQYNIDENNLPFIGYDVWNAYEVSAITKKGQPINAVMKLVIPANSADIIESKSLKLYLNSFNMTQLGQSAEKCTKQLAKIIESDLTKKLNATIKINLHRKASNSLSLIQEKYTDISKLIDLDIIDFTNTNTMPMTIQEKSSNAKTIKFSTDLLRSNCRVTNQPDWGDIFIHIKTQNIPNLSSVMQYIVSHRKINHFHEEVAEMIFMDLFKTYSPDELMVICLYTRRGGIDINPVRSTHSHLIPLDFIDSTLLNHKTLRQ